MPAFYLRENKVNLLNSHVSSHHGEVTGEGANILVYTWFGWGGKCNGVRFTRPKEICGSQDIFLACFWKWVGCTGTHAHDLLAKLNAANACFEDN